MKKPWENQYGLIIMFPHTTITFPQSWTSTASAPYRNYLEYQLMFYALFITVNSGIEVSGTLASCFLPTLMRYPHKASHRILNEKSH